MLLVCLSVYARALEKHIMKTTYILQDNESLDAMTTLARQYPEQEAYIRAILLNSFPVTQRAKEAQVKTAVAEMVAALGWCVPGKDMARFQSSVEEVTRKIADEWAPMQALETTIKPSFHTDFPDDWIPLPGPSSANQPATVAPAHKSKQPQKQAPGRGSEQPKEAPAIACPVWPSFVCIGSKPATDNLLCQGYGLTDA